MNNYFTINTIEDADSLLREVGCHKKVIDHCTEVAKLAFEIANNALTEGFILDLHLVRTGGLLHDIGRSKTHSIDHGVKGGQIARTLKLSEDVVRIIERHVGAGLPFKEAVKLGLPKKDYIPQTGEEKIVCYADKLIKGKKRITFKKSLQEYIFDLGAGHPAIQRFINLHHWISFILG